MRNLHFLFILYIVVDVVVVAAFAFYFFTSDIENAVPFSRMREWV